LWIGGRCGDENARGVLRRPRVRRDRVRAPSPQASAFAVAAAATSISAELSRNQARAVAYFAAHVADELALMREVVGERLGTLATEYMTGHAPEKEPRK